MAVLPFSRPLRGLRYLRLTDPSDKSLGYFQVVRFADYVTPGKVRCF